MSKSRILFLNSFIIFLLVSHLLVFLLDQGNHWHKSWPILYYSMYSKVHDKPVIKRILITGTTEADKEIELMQNSFYHPYTGRMIERALKSYDQPKHQLLAQEVLKKYQERRLSKKHQGPPLSNLSFSFVDWRIDPYLNSGGEKLSQLPYVKAK